eukprot:12628460-Heterocapsa_arctica.AAC.1
MKKEKVCENTLGCQMCKAFADAHKNTSIILQTNRLGKGQKRNIIKSMKTKEGNILKLIRNIMNLIFPGL